MEIENILLLDRDQNQKEQRLVVFLKVLNYRYKLYMPSGRAQMGIFTAYGMLKLGESVSPHMLWVVY